MHPCTMALRRQPPLVPAAPRCRSLPPLLRTAVLVLLRIEPRAAADSICHNFCDSEDPEMQKQKTNLEQLEDLIQLIDQATYMPR